MKAEFKGSIMVVRDLEDAIRASRKYTKGAFSRPQSHPIQGGDFPSKVLTEYYEVYPDLEISWDMDASNFWAWVWGDVVHIDVHLHYDYRDNKAKVIIYGGMAAVRELQEGIPMFGKILMKLEEGHNGSTENNKKKQVVGSPDRLGAGVIADPQYVSDRLSDK